MMKHLSVPVRPRLLTSTFASPLMCLAVNCSLLPTVHSCVLKLHPQQQASQLDFRRLAALIRLVLRSAVGAGSYLPAACLLSVSSSRVGKLTVHM